MRREPQRNIRVWLEDGSEDQEADSGSWPLQNIQLADSLKLKGYDFHFSFGDHTHYASQAVSELPELLTWLWRDDDPAGTEGSSSRARRRKAKPLFRVRIDNR